MAVQASSSIHREESFMGEIIENISAILLRVKRAQRFSVEMAPREDEFHTDINIIQLILLHPLNNRMSHEGLTNP